MVDASVEWSPVANGTARTIWRTAALSAGLVSEGRFGATVRLERQQRGASADWIVSASAFRRQGDWTISGTAGVSARPDFYYKHSVEAEIARAFGGLVLHAGYRLIAFPATTIHVVQPGASWYFPRGWLQARGYFPRGSATQRTGGTLLLRGSLDATPRLRLEAGAAAGSRIFDASALAGPGAGAWVVFGGASLRIATRWTIRASVGGAHEDPAFSQQTIALGARWTPR